jgi:thiamine biosynthesis lipoprotein
MKAAVDRRKFITISACASGLAALAGSARTSAESGHTVEWRGICLGAVATLRIHHPHKATATALVHQVVGEADRLEDIFSLYREDSVLCRLNRHGALASPPTELVELLTACHRYWEITGGVFDPTVQALWRCHAESFAAKDAAPTAAEKGAALQLVGWPKVRFDRNRVTFARAGMGLTLNGVAQGYITDRLLERLRACGINSCLVDMGEIRTLGAKPDGQPWSVAIEDASGKPSTSISVLNKAVATSGADGFRFDARGTSNHLFDPTTGGCAAPSRTVTVIAERATDADALSTAFTLMQNDAVGAALTVLAGAQAYTVEAGNLREICAYRGA